MTTVPHADTMDDETFRKHLERRHMAQGEWALLDSLRAGAQFTANRPVYHAYHARMHLEREYPDHDHA